MEIPYKGLKVVFYADNMLLLAILKAVKSVSANVVRLTD
jgi:hypothetical protein